MSPQSVVVTGASGTTGQAITLELAHAGFDVIATARTEERLLPELRVSAYRAQYSAVGEAARRCSRQAGARPVARAVLRALTAARPMPRYLVGGARSTAALDAVAPTVASDWAKQLLTGLRAAPPRVARAMRLPVP
ncbi:hypothetical protein [Streptomyces sp. ICBB 8177]|uniref:hypothetical protein n=1 Tax=Streptomyces sp. ICBB 8177 TaxID=563922 RepID=UPI000D67D3DD|nr:hypothetical protein [Streptomyces sp. ICBB 8177]PWI45233.1 hypothetical protein CK485_03510 [Streptomyces sp. ICBB 8177]